ncbi:hypothetical protein IGI04_014675 [Brassica rapa subsp. trilocularis]|uniref:Uncharacterized protein n=1 Tax=Brassica rapa subsp. trilocularis TaxID=1813537 RepID=A0ABQ7MMW1_BRACM|nr:hypothetical protein IGI04_014675 [Brassica rapa subsp. trilocularis]
MAIQLPKEEIAGLFLSDMNRISLYLSDRPCNQIVFETIYPDGRVYFDKEGQSRLEEMGSNGYTITLVKKRS